MASAKVEDARIDATLGRHECRNIGHGADDRRGGKGDSRRPCERLDRVGHLARRGRALVTGRHGGAERAAIGDERVVGHCVCYVYFAAGDSTCAGAPRAIDQAALRQSRCDSTTSRATSAIASVAATPIAASCHGCSCA